MIDYPITPVDFVTLHSRTTSGFRGLKQTDRHHPFGASQVRRVRPCRQLPQAARRLGGPYVGTMPFEDTEVYKAIEGASYSLAAAA